MSYRLNAPVTLGQIETNDTYLWEKMKQYITDHAIDIDTRDRILARLNTIIGGDKNFTVLSQQCDYLDTFKDSLYNLFVEQGATAIINYDIMQWVSAMRMKLGLFGCYIYAIDADDIEHFYTDTEWAAMRIEAAETGKELPKCFGSVINNSSYTIVIGYTKPNQTRQWGTYGRSCGASGNPTLLLRIYDPLQALYLYNDQLVQIVSSVEEIEERAETAPSGTRFVLMASVGEKVLAVGDYAMNGDKYEFIDSTSHPWIGLTKEAFTATEYLGAVQQFTVPYKDTQGIYGVPAELFCAQYHAFEGDDLVWRLPNQGELALLNVNYNMVNAQKSTVTDAMLPTGNVWSSQENNTNNANYTTLPGGSTNNNNKNNWYSVVPVAEFGLIADKYLDAEDDCFSNKKNRLDACEFHYNLHRLTKLASDVEDGTYRPSPSICFILDYPTYREVFAARYKDRIVHHLVAPYITHITEAVHRANGNVSHGNRVNYSAQTACVQIQELMRKYPNGYVLKMDIQGFFMSISRDIAWNVFLSFADKYRPEGISNYENEFMLNLIHTLLMSNPTDGCEKRSPDSKWEHIKPEKSLFNNDKGLPIGNYYSQLIANLLLAIVDAVLGIPHFVDDFSSAYETLDDVIVAIDRFRELTQSIGLKAHPKKIYIQPVRHGVKFCGRVIFTDRMYISNRTVKACKNSIKRFDKYSTDTILNAKKLIQSVNSYTGIMCSLNSYNIQKSLIELAMGTKFGKYMVVKEKSNHLILNLKKEYTPKALSESAINKLDEIHRNNVRNCKELRKKRCCKDRTDV